MILIVVLWLALCAVLVIAVHAYGQTTDRIQQADVIIVLGAGMRYDGRPGPALVRRTNHAVEAWQDDYAQNIICTGGIPLGRSHSEASGCRDVLISQGVPADAIFLEEQSRSTEENAIYTHEMMEANGWASAILITDAYHLLRAQWIFSMEGVTVYPSPTVNPSVGPYALAVIREVAALQWQAVKRLLQLPVTYIPTL
jgi:uncharacterized SAM-binding protein YcdF (DUF218 family)